MSNSAPTPPVTPAAVAHRLSVVLIARNEADRVAPLIESVLAQAASLGGDVVLVDSASEDGTVEVARRYPIRIVRLLPGQRLTAAAGRAAGLDATAGESVLFLDGDMELLPGWLPNALALVESSPEVAGVTGQIVNVFPGGAPPAPRIEPAGDAPEVIDVPCRKVGGIGLYRRATLRRAGSFRASLYSDEEPELCLRLTRAGSRMLRIEQPAVLHHVGASPTIGALFARRRRKLYLGYGQATRALVGSRLLVPYLRARGYALVPAAVVLAGIACVAWLVVAHAWIGLTAWSALVLAALAADAVRKRSVYRMCYSVLNRLFILEGMVRGFVVGGGDDYRPRVEVVK